MKCLPSSGSFCINCPHSFISSTSIYLLVQPLQLIKKFYSLQSLKHSFPPTTSISVQAYVVPHLENSHSLMTNVSASALVFSKPICQVDLSKVEIFATLLFLPKMLQSLIYCLLIKIHPPLLACKAFSELGSPGPRLHLLLFP